MPAFSVYFDKSLKYNLFDVLLMSFYTMGLNPFWINQIFKLFWFKLNCFFTAGRHFSNFPWIFCHFIIEESDFHFTSFHIILQHKEYNKISDKIIDANLNLVYDRNHYFSFGPIPKPKPKLVDTFGRYRNRYRNHISKGKSSYQ